MGLIVRNTKTGGNTTFATEYAAGYRTIKAAEVDADFDTIYSLVNGSLDSNNLASNAVTTAKITNLAVDSTKLAANAVIEAKIDTGAVTMSKLGLGSCGLSGWANDVSAPQTIYGTDSETTVWSSKTLTPRGGGSLVLVHGNWNMEGVMGVVPADWYPLVRVYRNTTLVCEYSTRVWGSGGDSIQIPAPICLDNPTAVSTTYHIKVLPQGTADDYLYIPNNSPGKFWLLQIS